MSWKGDTMSKGHIPSSYRAGMTSFQWLFRKIIIKLLLLCGNSVKVQFTLWRQMAVLGSRLLNSSPAISRNPGWSVSCCCCCLHYQLESHPSKASCSCFCWYNGFPKWAKLIWKVIILHNFLRTSIPREVQACLTNGDITTLPWLNRWS